MTAEQQRLSENANKTVPLERWGPYLSERQWGTVREDYGEHGDAWGYFPFEHSHFRSYLWGEDGLAGISDYFQNLCFCVALWNGKDPILKERLFGLGNYSGNHGEDVKELYYYLDNVPSHYYMEYLYKYPQSTFPYKKLYEENKKRNRLETEYEILDTPVFRNNHYFDVKVTYAKQSGNDVFIKIDITNLYHRSADLTVLPTLWFSNKWSTDEKQMKPLLEYVNKNSVHAWHNRLGDYYFYFSDADDLWFTENETNKEKFNGTANRSIFVKDAFHDAVLNNKNKMKLSEKWGGTKCAPVYNLHLKAKETKTL